MTRPRYGKPASTLLTMGLALLIPAPLLAQATGTGPGLSSGSGAGTGTGTSSSIQRNPSGSLSGSGPGPASGGRTGGSAPRQGDELAPDRDPRRPGEPSVPLGPGANTRFPDDPSLLPFSTTPGEEGGDIGRSTIPPELIAAARSITDPAERSLSLQRIGATAILGDRLDLARETLARRRPGIAGGPRPARPRSAAHGHDHDDAQPHRGPDASGEGQLAPPGRGRARSPNASGRPSSLDPGVARLLEPRRRSLSRGSRIPPTATKCSAGSWRTRRSAARPSRPYSRGTRAREQRGPNRNALTIPMPTASSETQPPMPLGSIAPSGAIGRCSWSSPVPRRPNQFARGLEIARTIPQAEIRADALMRIAEAQSRSNRGPAASATYQEAVRAVASIPLDDPRDILTGVLIDSLISVGRFDDARASIVLYSNAVEPAHRPGGRGRVAGAARPRRLGACVDRPRRPPRRSREAPSPRRRRSPRRSSS